MRILGLTDIHGTTEKLAPAALGANLEDADLVVISGDLTHFGSERDVEGVIRQLRKFNQKILAVTGNCDPAAVEAYLTEQGINLHARYIEQAGYGFIGLGGSLPTPGGMTPNEYSEEELERCLRDGADGLDTASSFLLVSHGPPFNTKCDRAAGEHVGSRRLREFIEKYQPLVCFSGHIHESRGIDLIGKTRIVNPGPLREGGYSLIEIDDDRVNVRLYRGSSLLDQMG
jgi:Icc-related predicted phosphoesterase